MVSTISSKDIELRASLGVVKDYFKQTDDFTQDPPVNYNLLFDMYENDTVLTTAIDTTVDVATTEGYTFIGTEDSRKLREIKDKFENELDFDRVIRNVIYQILIYGDAFLELRREGGNGINELFPLETTEMAIKYDEHGNILGFVQRPEGYLPEQAIPFSEEEVVHFRLKWIGSSVYSKTPFKSIMREYATKKFASVYLSRIFSNFPPRLLYVLKNANKEQTKFFIENLKRAKNQPHKDLVGFGDIDVKENGLLDFNGGLTDVLNYLRTEISMITKVPPIWLGIPDNSNRSNSEAQIRSFETRVRSIQQILESEINKKFLPQLGFGNKIKFKFNPLSLMSEKSILENAKQLQDLRLDDDTILQYIKDKGFKLRPEAEIEETVDPAVGMDGENPETNQGEAGQQSKNLDANGVSEAGKKKTEEKEIRSKWTYDSLGETK